MSILCNVQINMYGVLIAIGILLGIFVACKICKNRNLVSDDIYKITLYVLPLAILGARIYYCVFSKTSYTFLEFLKIWEGGIAIYGAVLGGLVGVVLFCLIHKKNFFEVADVAVVSLILGQAIGRIGCYFAGCCYGIEVTNQSLMWFPFSTQIDGVWHYSTFFYESFCNFIIFGVLLYLILKKVKTKGIILSLYLICYGTIRCIIETFRGDSLYIGSIKVSQLLSGILIVIGIALFIILLCSKNKNSEKSIPSKDKSVIKKGTSQIDTNNNKENVTISLTEGDKEDRSSNISTTEIDQENKNNKISTTESNQTNNNEQN